MSKIHDRMEEILSDLFNLYIATVFPGQEKRFVVHGFTANDRTFRYEDRGPQPSREREITLEELVANLELHSACEQHWRATGLSR